jgi:hypothetical protein
LLRWLVMVYDILESYTALSQLYGVLFNLLDMITLRYTARQAQTKINSNIIQESFVSSSFSLDKTKAREAFPHPSIVSIPWI